MTYISPKLMTDKNGQPIPVMPLSSPQVVDGTAQSTLSTVINGSLIRIASEDNSLHVLTGPASTAGTPLAVTATTGIFIAALGELWLPIADGQVVAVLGGKANICIAGV
jgi:hypothetical protein